MNLKIDDCGVEFSYGIKYPEETKSLVHLKDQIAIMKDYIKTHEFRMSICSTQQQTDEGFEDKYKVMLEYLSILKNRAEQYKAYELMI